MVSQSIDNSGIAPRPDGPGGDAPSAVRQVPFAVRIFRSSMLRYIVRRLIWCVFLLFIISLVSFVIFNVLPTGDPVRSKLGTRFVTPGLLKAVTHAWGLDKPLYVQYLMYMKNVFLHFNFGYSYVRSESINSELWNRMPVTISVALGAFVLWMLIGVPIGIISAVKRRSWIDRVSMTGALVAISAPVYWLGLIALYMFANDIGRWHLFPGMGSYLFMSEGNWTHWMFRPHWFYALFLPWCVLAAAFAAFYARMVRGSIIETMNEDYIRTARAKGLSERRVIFRHGLRAALTPVVTMAGMDIGGLLGGAVLTETVFNIPGIGRYAYESILSHDLPAIQATVLLAGFFIIFANLIVDILYAFLDPRVRY